MLLWFSCWCAGASVLADNGLDTVLTQLLIWLCNLSESTREGTREGTRAAAIDGTTSALRSGEGAARPASKAPSQPESREPQESIGAMEDRLFGGSDAQNRCSPLVSCGPGCNSMWMGSG